MKRIVLAHSGGFDTSVAIPWLAETCGAEIVTVTIDLGQGRELVHVRERALALGAVRAHVLDARHEFARSFAVCSLQAGALYGQHPLPVELGRSLIVKKVVEVARMEAAGAVAHGCAAARDRGRMDRAITALAPGIDPISLASLWAQSRFDQLAYARARRIPPSPAMPYIVNGNLWGRSIVRVDPAAPPDPPSGIFTLTRSRSDSPDEPAYVEIAFDLGVPVAANGIEMPLLELIESLETIAGAHGVGRLDAVKHGPPEQRLDTCEAPAAIVLHQAHRELERLVLPGELIELKQPMARLYAEIVREGRWFSHTREAIDAFVSALQTRVTGSVRLRLFKGECRVVGRQPAIASDDRLSAATPVPESQSV